MPWSVQRQSRPSGAYYSALWINEKKERTRCVSVGRIASQPATATLTARLREHDPDGRLKDAVVTSLCLAADDDAVRGVLRSHRHFLGGAEIHVAGEPREKVAAPLREPTHPKGGMLLRDYVADIWERENKKTPATWEREYWWWIERILPVLGDLRLCDLDEPRWTAFLKGLTVGGKSKTLCQTAYRTAITHAVDELGWIDAVHRFKPIEGSTRRTLAEPEPLTLEETFVFLDATVEPVHRALFAVQIGLGLRPAEVLRIEWQDVRWKHHQILIRGTKNKYAEATIPMTPLAYDELHKWWVAKGEPKTGIAFSPTGEEGPFKAYPKTAFNGTCRRSGLNSDRKRRLFPYGCRHAFATIAVRMGTDRADLKMMMRHSDDSTVADDAYIRVHKEEVAKAFAGFGAKKAV